MERSFTGIGMMAELYRLQKDPGAFVKKEIEKALPKPPTGAAAATARNERFRAAIKAGNDRAMLPRMGERLEEETDAAWNNVFERERSAYEREYDRQESMKENTLAVWNAMGEGATRYYETVVDSMALVNDAVTNTFRNIEDNMSSVFFDAMMGKMKSFKEYLSAFVQDIGRTISQMMSRYVMQLAIQGVASGVGGLFGGAGASTGGFPARLAEGGVTNGISIAGESGPEAVVPLPDGRRIPVDLKGGGGRGVTVNFNINAVDGPSVQRMLVGQRNTISQIIQEAMGRDQQLRGALQAV
jgi:hypothetical protein